VSNTSSNGHMKAAAGGQAVRRAIAAATPPSAEVNGQAFAEVVGRTVAVQLANMLAQLLPRMPWQPSCQMCIVAAKQAIRAHEIACQNAVQAGEEQPVLPEPPNVAQAVTLMPSAQSAIGPDGQPRIVGVAELPVCFDHIQLPEDSPRPTGLVTGSGAAILHTGRQ
jgi:hypothetical protein